MFTRIALGLAVSLAAAASAQDLGVKAPPQDRPVVIRHGRVHTVSGSTIDGGAVLIENGRITKVGPDAAVSVPAGAVVVDATGKRVYPGLVAAVTSLGLSEIGMVRATIDSSETGEITPETRAVVAVNPDSTLIPVARSAGILTAGVFPASELVGGQPGVIRLDGWTWEQMCVESSIGLVVEWPSTRGSRDRQKERRELLDEAFRDATAYNSIRQTEPDARVDTRREAVRAVLPAAGRQLRVFIRADRAEQIGAAVAWAAQNGLKPVIIGGSEAPECAELLIKHDIPVIVTGVHQIPFRDDAPYDHVYALPSRLQAAGVRWCLTGGESPAHERNIAHHAASAVAFGLDPETAVRAITLSAAEVLGVDDRLGSIDVGKSGTVIVTSGDVLEVSTRIEHAFIDGRTVDLSNKQTKLAEKYRERYRQEKK